VENNKGQALNIGDQLQVSVFRYKIKGDELEFEAKLEDVEAHGLYKLIDKVLQVVGLLGFRNFQCCC
jgi:hypothetical protein